MKRFMVLIVILMISSCTAQSANNDAQRIVGTWIQDNGTVWVFNANGTGNRGDENFFFGVSSVGIIKITIWSSIDFALCWSPDGRRVIIGSNVLQRS